MMSSAKGFGSTRTTVPFTASQWQELEHQALIFKYMVSGMPIPPDLLYTLRRSFDSSLSSKLLLHHHQPQLGWNCFQLGFGRKIDPEPGRCRRTDGKKWRCSKEAYPDSKYCERHMHRGRNRSRKPVEQHITTLPSPPTLISSISANNTSSPSSPTSHHSFSCLNSLATSSHPATLQYHPFLYPHSSQENSTSTPTNFLLQSSGPYSQASKGYSYGHQGGKGEVEEHEHAFFCEASGTMRNLSGSSLGNHMHQRPSFLQLQSLNHDNNCNMTNARQQKQDGQQQQYYGIDRDDHQPKKVMHHFFDEWPPKDNKDSCWLDNNDHDHKLSKIQLSISMPNSSSHHDFFMTRNEK